MFRRRQARIDRALTACGHCFDLNQMLAHFIRAQLILAALTFVMYSAVLAMMRVPNALALGTVGGLLEFIPVVGPLVAGLIIVGVALLMSFPHWLWIVVFLGVWRLIQDYVTSPRIMGRSMELHPLAAIFGVMAGGEVAGILGIFLSIPVMASLRIVFRPVDTCEEMYAISHWNAEFVFRVMRFYVIPSWGRWWLVLHSGRCQ